MTHSPLPPWMLLATLLLLPSCGPSATSSRPAPSDSAATDQTAEDEDAPDKESDQPTPSTPPPATAPTESTAPNVTPPAPTTFVLGDLAPPFDTPPWEQLKSQTRWIDRPVVDALQRLRERQATEEPKGTLEEALAARNDSESANELICSVLGRLPQSDQELAPQASLIRHTSVDLKTTNPLMVSTSIEQELTGLTSFGLFGYDWAFIPFASADTVVSWQTSEDRLYDKVVMRNDLTWSDGHPITAHDVEFSYRVIMSSTVPVPAVRSGTDQLKAVRAYDDHTLIYFHKEGLATNDWNINFPVIPKHIYEKSIAEDPKLQVSDYHVKLENAPVVGGPFQITQRTRGKEILLEARPEYFQHQGKQVRRPPHFKQVRFRIIAEPSVTLLAMKRGDIDEMILQPEQWKTQTNDDDFYSKCTKAYGTEWVEFHFCWNCQTPFFSDKRVRQAMSYAFDHEEMLKTLLYGLYQPCNGIYNQSSTWAPSDAAPPYRQDLAKAEALLTEAGWTDSDGDGILDKLIDDKRVPFKFAIWVNDHPDRVEICNLLRECLDQIGIVCEVRPIEFTVLQERCMTHNFEATFGGWGTGTDPDTGENIWKTKADRNFGQYSNPEVDRLYELGKREFDPEKRRAIYHQIHRLLYDDQPYTWLYFRNSYFAFTKDLRGYVFSPRGPYSYGPGFDSLWKPAAH